MTTQFPLTGPLSVGDLLDRAFRLYRARFGVFLLTAAIFLFPIERLFNRVGFDMLDFLLDGLRSDLLDDSSGAGTTNSVSSLGMDLLAYFIAALLAILTSAPSYYLYARWLVAPAALLAEGLGPISSLRRSWQLSRGHIWRMIGYTVLLYLLVRLFNSLPMNLFQMILSVFLPDLNLGLQTGVVTAVQSTLFAVSTPFYIGAVVLLYYDLRIRGESYDLELRVADLEKQAGQGTAPDTP